MFSRHAAELSTDSSLGQMPTQQAVVQSFLKNYDKVSVLIILLEGEWVYNETQVWRNLTATIYRFMLHKFRLWLFWGENVYSEYLWVWKQS